MDEVIFTMLFSESRAIQATFYNDIWPNWVLLNSIAVCSGWEVGTGAGIMIDNFVWKEIRVTSGVP